MPQSNGTLSHLCRRWPSCRPLRRPPSARACCGSPVRSGRSAVDVHPRVRARAIGISSSNGSNAAMLRSAALSTTMLGPSAASACERLRRERAGIVGRAGPRLRVPNPRKRAARSRCCAASLMKIRGWRRAAQSIARHVPAPALQHRVARRREAGEVRHLAAGRERERRLARQVEQLLDPRPGHFLHHRRRRCHRKQARVPVPRGRQPVGGERRVERPADHPGIEPAAW